MKRRMHIGDRIVFAVAYDEYAAHFWFKKTNTTTIGGIELHWSALAPHADNENCWLLGKPCCHDGSSLQATERFLPLFEECNETGDFEPLWLLIDQWAGYAKENMEGE